MLTSKYKLDIYQISSRIHYVQLFSVIIVFVLFSCANKETDKTAMFKINFEDNRTYYNQNDSLEISITNKISKDNFRYELYIDERELKAENQKVKLSVSSLGNKSIKAIIYLEEDTLELFKKIKVLAPYSPKIYTYEILNEFPHDANAFTQGLEFHGDTLYESTGKRGRSTLRKVDYRTGGILKQVDLSNTVFGEGITILNDHIYMLTWQSGEGYVYDIQNLEIINSFQYGKSKLGWGLANDGTKLFKSDGTEKIWTLDHKTLTEQYYIQTVTDKSIFNRANEMEYVDGKLYANVYQKPSVMIIDAKSGAIEGVVNFGGLDKNVNKHSNWDDSENVLNGIAYHPIRKTFFVTGKEWDKLFEVRILEK